MPALYLNTGRSAGEQLSSTYEGRMLSLEESFLTHITHAPDLVAGGDPVSFGNIVGVAMSSAAAATDIISIDTEGIWFLPVVASNDVGTSAVAPGDALYIAAGIVSKKSSGLSFGYSLGDLGASAVADVCAVKVHFEEHAAGTPSLRGQRFEVSYPSFAAADVAKGFFIAPAPCRVISAYHAHRVVAGQAGTLNVEKCTTGEAPAAGDVVLGAANWDLTSVVDTPVSIAALATGVENLVAGDQLRLKLIAGGAAGLADAVVTMLMQWV